MSFFVYCGPNPMFPSAKEWAMKRTVRSVLDDSVAVNSDALSGICPVYQSMASRGVVIVGNSGSVYCHQSR